MSSLYGNAEPQLGSSYKKDESELSEPKTGKWYSRGFLPHYDSRDRFQSITFRLADSLPRKKLEELEERLKTLPKDEAEAVKRKAIEKWLDAGIGCCALQQDEMARVMEETLLKFDGDRYQLCAWRVMPNHVHVLIKPQEKLGRIVQGWKSFTGRWALKKNAELGLSVPGKNFWMREYWDRYIRNDNHFKRVVDYIHKNPVVAGLCNKSVDWPWSSARNFPGNAEPQLFYTMSNAELGLGAPGKPKNPS